MDTTPDAAWQGQIQALLRNEPAGRHLSEHDWLALADGRALGQRVDPPSDGLEHLARCDECRAILRAIRLLRTDAQAEQLVAPPSRRRWMAGLAVAASLLVGSGVWLLLAPRSGDPSSGRPWPADTSGLSGVPPAAVADARDPGRPAPAEPTPAWLRPVPPAIALYSPGLLTMRGGDTPPFGDAFGEAMAPWQAGNHAEAALRLDALARQYPDVAEAHFYRGAAWLLAGVPDDAVDPLRRAVALAPSSLQADASWYLGLALLQTQRRGDAQRVFSDACTAGDPRACRAATHLDPTRPTTP